MLAAGSLVPLLVFAAAAVVQQIENQRATTERETLGRAVSAMSATVKVVPRTEYDSFVSQRANGGVTLGQEEWRGVCLSCHRLGHRYIGPDLKGNSLLADRHGIEVLLRNGRGQMPSVGRDWSGLQIDALVAYTKQFAGGGKG